MDNKIYSKIQYIGYQSLINTVLGYKKRLKSQNIFSDFENMYFQLSNALSIVFIRCLDTKIHNIEI